MGPKICSEPECSNQVRKDGLCPKHADWEPCVNGDCGNPGSSGFGLCGKCYQNNWQNGSLPSKKGPAGIDEVCSFCGRGWDEIKIVQYGDKFYCVTHQNYLRQGKPLGFIKSRQQRATGKWDESTLRALLRNFTEWSILYQQKGMEEIQLGDVVVNIEDVLPAVATLTPRQRQVIYFTCIQDLKDEDCSPLMNNIPCGVISQYRARAIVKLLKLLGGKDETTN